MVEQASSPPSSPPMASTADAVQTLEPTRKRSHEEMNRDMIEVPPSSHTFAGGDDPSQPYATAPSSMQPPSEKAPTSGQGSVSVPRSQHGASPQVHLAGGNTENENPPVTEDEVSQEEGAASLDSSQQFDPEEKVQYFDWNDLQERYHDKIRELEMTEAGIYREFTTLCQYFDIWAQAGSRQEVDRSFKRLKTRMTLVQHHENELEQKRQHYVQVVNAFKSALQLLAK